MPINPNKPSNIAVVVPTIRDECWKSFMRHWFPLFEKHNVTLIKVHDGENPLLSVDNDKYRTYTIKEIMGDDSDLIFNKNDGVRNLGFAYIRKHLPEIEYILTLDDDTAPVEGQDAIQQHLDVLNKRFPLDWMSTASDYVRGIPYGIREDALCTVSHGVWNGVMDWDAPTQLIKGNRQLEFFKGVIPRNIYFPFCGMNIMFTRQMLPYMYYAPMGYRVNMDRFADIWLGITLKRICDKNNWAIASGYSTIVHERASNVWKNLQKEARGLELNETFWKGDESDEYFKLYNTCKERWEKL